MLENNKQQKYITQKKSEYSFGKSYTFSIRIIRKQPINKK